MGKCTNMTATIDSAPPDASSNISCDNCEACCCRLEVMLMGDDDVPARFSSEDAWGGWVMRRLDDGWCAALDRNSMRCTIYQRRPLICRDYAMGADDCIEERQRFLRRKTGRPGEATLNIA